MRISEAIYSLLLTLLILSSTSAQDVHLSNFDLMPSFFNPAWNLNNAGDAQASILYRNQSFNITPTSYTTYAAYFQSKLLRQIRAKDHLNIHGVIISDKSGTGNLKSNSGYLGFSYHLSLDENAKHVLSLGIQGGYNQMNISDFDGLIFEEELLGGNFSEDIIDEGMSNIKWSFGFLQRSQLNPNFMIEFGAALANQKYLIQSARSDFSTLKYSFQIAAIQRINDAFSVRPRWLYQNTNDAKNMMIQLLADYHLNQTKDISLQFGGGLRMDDAAQLLLGIQFKNWRGGFSYDISTSDLAKAGNRSSGIEFGLMYTHNFPEIIEEEPVPEPIVIVEEEPPPAIPVDPKISLDLQISDDEGPLMGSTLMLTTKEDTTNTSNVSGSKYSLDLENNRTYRLILSKEGYKADTSFVFTTQIERDSIITRIIDLQLLPAPEPIKVVKGKPVRLNNIYYNLNDYQILPESEQQLLIIHKAMITYPDLEIEISSHTDSQGEGSYNLTLSSKRAKSVIDWLTKQGISEDRMKSVGYGETKIINHCKNGVKCSDEEHRVNRRTEFKVLKGPEVIYLKQ